MNRLSVKERDLLQFVTKEDAELSEESKVQLGGVYSCKAEGLNPAPPAILDLQPCAVP